MGNCCAGGGRSSRSAAVQEEGDSDSIVLGATPVDEDFSFAGKRFLAKVHSVYDGDTVRVIFKYRGEFILYKARMDGYDSPEMKPSKTSPHREAEKEAAITARDALQKKIGNNLVIIECGKFDKYGRILVTMFARKSGENINLWMLRNGYGVPYDGGRKSTWGPS